MQAHVQLVNRNMASSTGGRAKSSCTVLVRGHSENPAHAVELKRTSVQTRSPEETMRLTRERDERENAKLAASRLKAAEVLRLADLSAAVPMATEAGPDSALWAVDDRCRAAYGDSDNCYAAKVVRVTYEGLGAEPKFTVDWDDGDQEHREGLTAAMLQPLNITGAPAGGRGSGEDEAAGTAVPGPSDGRAVSRSDASAQRDPHNVDPLPAQTASGGVRPGMGVLTPAGGVMSSWMHDGTDAPGASGTAAATGEDTSSACEADPAAVLDTVIAGDVVWTIHPVEVHAEVELPMPAAAAAQVKKAVGDDGQAKMDFDFEPLRNDQSDPREWRKLLMRVYPGDLKAEAQKFNEYMWEHLKSAEFKPETGGMLLNGETWFRFLLVAVLGGICPEQGMEKFKVPGVSQCHCFALRAQQLCALSQPLCVLARGHSTCVTQRTATYARSRPPTSASTSRRATLRSSAATACLPTLPARCARGMRSCTRSRAGRAVAARMAHRSRTATRASHAACNALTNATSRRCVPPLPLFDRGMIRNPCCRVGKSTNCTDCGSTNCRHALGVICRHALMALPATHWSQ